jgi:hypothetical protein
VSARASPAVSGKERQVLHSPNRIKASPASLPAIAKVSALVYGGAVIIEKVRIDVLNLGTIGRLTLLHCKRLRTAIHWAN